MKAPEPDALDRVLSTDDELQPMIGFSTRVMRAVRDEAASQPPIPFPWARFLPGVLLNFALLFGTAIWLLSTEAASGTARFPVEWLADPLTRGLLLAGVTMIGSGLLAWLTTRWVSRPLSTSF